jgi:hypothetical protein
LRGGLQSNIFFFFFFYSCFSSSLLTLPPSPPPLLPSNNAISLDPPHREGDSFSGSDEDVENSHDDSLSAEAMEALMKMAELPEIEEVTFDLYRGKVNIHPV